MSRSPDDPRLRALALALLPGVGAKEYHDRSARFGSAAQAFDAVARTAESRDALQTARSALDRADQIAASLLLRGDLDYPESLAELHQPPPFLFLRGDRTLLDRPMTAVVGTRHPTTYGVGAARDLAAALAQSGVVIVSGMARGIDAVAHRAALDAGGTTIAVLGAGVDVTYPKCNAPLQHRVAKHGLLVSEHPCGTMPHPKFFPRRNRIIAALARCTIVVEAGEKSGALITSNLALDLNRSIAAVPGPIDSPQSVGTNRLLRDGAQVIASIDDALSLAGCSPSAPPPLDPPADAAGRALWDALATGPADPDTLCARSGLSVREANVAITTLELRGLVECDLLGTIRRTDARRAGRQPPA